jgi:hypothetical protein
MVFVVANTTILRTLMLTLMMQIRRAPGQAVWLSRNIALCFGLGLSNHWPLFVLSSPLVIAMLWPWDRSRIILFIKAIPFLLVGLLPYLWMVIRSQMDPVISFYGPINSLYKLWFVISRAGYADVDTSSTATWIDKYEFAVYFDYSLFILSFFKYLFLIPLFQIFSKGSACLN